MPKSFAVASIMLVDERGTISGPMQQPGQMTYRFRTTDSDVIRKLSKAGVNIVTYDRMLALQDKLLEILTAYLVSEQLGMTPRNARRILTALEKHGLTQLVGLEAPLSKGQPRRMYKVGPSR